MNGTASDGRRSSVSPLGQFLGSYLGQDWKDEFPTAWSAVEVYVSEMPIASRREARAELDDVLRSNHTEDELSRAMDRIRMDYHPPGVGGTYRGFLEKVERYLREHED